MSRSLRIYRIIRLVLTGAIVIPLTILFQAVATDYNGEGVFPEGFIYLIIWLVGATLSFVKKVEIIGLIISFLPIAYLIYVYIAEHYFS